MLSEKWNTHNADAPIFVFKVFNDCLRKNDNLNYIYDMQIFQILY